MQKIPTLFKRVFNGRKIVNILPEVTEGMEWVLNNEGIATVKWDGSCCAVFDNIFYKRYDAKKGKIPPVNAIPCCEPDLVTGHWPHWVPVDFNSSSDKWFIKALYNTYGNILTNVTDGTYEAVGPHFQGNPYNLKEDTLVPHGTFICYPLKRTFEGIKDYLYKHKYEGIVFWKDNKPQCKIKRTDFGFEWPIKNQGQ